MTTHPFEQDDEVLTCVDAISAVLPLLVARYDAVVVMAALADNLTVGIRALVRHKHCTPAHASALLREIERVATAH